jgi:hypothetical protein
MNQPTSQLPEDPLDDEALLAAEEVPVDDRIIGRALRWSAAVLLLLVALGAAAWLLMPGPTPAERINDAPSQAPRELTAAQAQPPTVRFTDVTDAWGIDFTHRNGAYGERLLPETMGSGLAVFDMNDDGRQDLLLVNARPWPWRDSTQPMPSAALYRNDGDGRFIDITAGSGLDVPIYGTGVAIADLDGNGLRDVFISAVGENHLFRNLGEGRFEDITKQAGVAGDPAAWSTSALFFDFDRDGHLDLFVLNYVQWSREIDFDVDYRLTGIGRAYGPPTNYAGSNSYLYRNNGDGSFSDVSAAAGIEVANRATDLPMGKGLAVTALDIDEDGWLDLMVANDTVQNFLFRNRGDGSFEEIGTVAGVAFDNAGSATGAMGVDAAWYTNDDDIAIAVGNFANEMTSFYVAQQGSGQFTDEAIVSGIGPDSRQALSFGLFFFDYDLDGWLDLLQTNGHVEDEINAVQPSQHYEQSTQLFWNCATRCSRPLVPVPLQAAGDLGRPVVGRSAAYGDLDGDGDLDVVISQVGRPPLLLRNDQSTEHSWLRIALVDPGSNRDAIGARVSLRSGEQTQRRTLMPGHSYQSYSEPVLTFGLGEAKLVDELRVSWPGGGETVLRGVAVDQLLTLRREN